MLSFALSLATFASLWTPVVADRCDVVVDVSHWVPWGGNEKHDIQGDFWQHSIARGVGSIETRKLFLHELSTAEIREGVRVSSKARIIGRWMDFDRKVMLPLRLEVIERRSDL